MTKAQELIETTARLSRAGFTSWQIQKLLSFERRLHRLDERCANGDGWSPGKMVTGYGGNQFWERTWDDSDDKAYDRKCEAIYKSINAILESRNESERASAKPLKMYHQGDCRGGALWLIPADLENANSCYSSRGICV